MKKIELLSPAGNMDSLIAAVEAGCDAVYLGGTLLVQGLLLVILMMMK